MAIDSFKKTIWEAGLITEFHKTSIAEVISTKPSDVQGNKVIFNRLKSTGVKDYTGTIDWEEIVTEPIEMLFDQKKYWADTMADLDKVQAVKDLTQDVITEKTAELREVEDAYLLALLGNSKNMVGGVKLVLTPENTYDTIVSMSTVLSKNKVPKANRFVIVSSDITGILARDKRFTANPNVLANGVVEGQVINGLQVIECEELPVNTMIAIHSSACGFGRQLSETEAMRLQNTFADGIRGLDCYGGIILRPEAVAVAKYSLTAPVQA